MPSGSPTLPHRIRRGLTAAAAAVGLRLVTWAALASLLIPARAEVQFDVFLGYDDHVREGSWFPVAFEIYNDGPTFAGLVELGPEAGFDAQRRTFSVELPTGTRKRVVIPLFSHAGRYARWDARLYAPDGTMVAERDGLQPKDTAPNVPLLGATPRTFGGLPSLPEVPSRPPEFVPAVARLQLDYLPSNPIALEGLSAWYLNSERAADLKPDQVDALLAWLHAGGHLIVAIEHPGDVQGLPWLASLLPFVPQAVTPVPSEGCFERWLVSGQRVLQLPAVLRRTDPARRGSRPGRVEVQTPSTAGPVDPFARIEPQNDFNSAEIPVVTGRRLGGQTVLGLGNHPLIVSAPRGFGAVTVLAFSPEREPFRSWRNRSWFWAKLIGVPAELLVEAEGFRWGGPAVDGLFGAMLDSRQVRKLPVGALLLLLVLYLAVIGPFDQWILKRLGRQMWTWITFPAYVAVFSGLIYLIGYRLRAGDLEWNELQVVDQLPRGETATLRGRTWASIYSPANARYRLISEQAFATFRAEFQSGGGSRRESGRLGLRHPARGFEAEAFVPVWVSQLYASDWFDTGPTLVAGRIQTDPGTAPRLILENRSSLDLGPLLIAYTNRVHEIAELRAGQRLERELKADNGKPIEDLLAELQGALSVVQQRRYAFGREGAGQMTRDLQGVFLASFNLRAAATEESQDTFTGAPGFDLSHLLYRGDGVLLAWAGRQSIAPPIHRFSPGRLQRDTALRIAVPVVPSH